VGKAVFKFAYFKVKGDTNEFIYNFAEGGGDTAFDASGNGNHGTLINAVSWTKQDIYHYNFENGYSLYQHNTDTVANPDIRVPLGINPAITNYTKIEDVKPSQRNHNGAETKIDFNPYNAPKLDGLGISDYNQFKKDNLLSLKNISGESESLLLYSNNQIESNYQRARNYTKRTNQFNENSFIITVNIENNGDSFTLPLVSGGSYNFNADWGDLATDQITTYNQAEVTHTYATAGSYDIDMNGNIEGWAFANGGDKLKITDVKQWGDINGVKFLGGEGFYGCVNLDVSAIDVPNLSLNLSSFFRDCSLLIGNSSFANWDVSSVTDMALMFYNTPFNQDISSWDVSSVTDMRYMFEDSSFNQNISSWDVSSITNMERMFRDSPFNQDIGYWDVSSVTNMRYMFTNAPLSTINYDSLLVGWESLMVQNNVIFDANIANYTLGSAAETARAALIADHNWTITDGGGI
jgi:surface protein